MRQSMELRAEVDLGSLSPDEVEVQAYYGIMDHHDEITSPLSKSLKCVAKKGSVHQFEGAITFYEGGLQGLTIRVLPRHPQLTSNPDMFLCTWAE